MLEFKTIRHLKADKDFLKFIGTNTPIEVKTTDGAILEVKKTNILTRKAKKDIIQKYVKEIEVRIDNNYAISIEKIIFYNDFMQNDLFSFKDFLLQKVKEKNETFEIKGMYSEIEFNEIIKNNKSITVYDYAQLVKFKAYEYEHELSDIEKLKRNKPIQIYAISKNKKDVDRFKIVVLN